MKVLVRMALATQLHYTVNFIAYLAIQSAAQLLTLLYLHTVFTHTDTLNGWNRDQAVFVFYLATIVVLSAECFTCSIQQYYQRLVRGQLDPLLMLPLRGRALQLLRWSQPGFLLPTLLLLCCWPWVDPRPERAAWEWVVGLLALVLGVLAIVVVFALVSLPALLTERPAPADFMVSELGRMLFLPPSVMPGGGWRLLLGMTLPLLFSANAAAGVLVAGDYSGAALLAIGTATLALVHQVAEARLLRSFSYPGG